MGRNAQNIDLLVAKGNKHFTKAEIEARKEAEVKLGKKDLKKIKPPTYVVNNLVAYEKWKSLMKDYTEAAKNNIEILTSTDVEILAKYCTTYSEYLSLIDRRNRVDEIDFVMVNYPSKESAKIRGEKRKSLNEVYRLDQVIKIETAINKKHDLLIKLEDRLFLNPLAKVKNVPKAAKEKPKNPMEAKFGI
ncbi:MAG: terminase [Clostridia bacterium]|nr:terminase [Clostridia bacterium]